MRLIIISLTLALLAGSAQAASYTETIDAGDTLPIAAIASPGAGATALSDIFGTIDTINDADLYRIYIADPTAFSATTNTATYGLYPDADTALFLFDAAGHAIAANDDDPSGQTYNATLPVGNSLYVGLSAGYYYLGVSDSTNEPTNGGPANQVLFPQGDLMQVRGPASGVTPTTLGGFDANAYDQNLPGPYRVALTGVSLGPALAAAAPEPATWLLMLAGLGFVGAMLRRRAFTPLAPARASPS
jgi:hypothetical protein